jgi:2'-5' RNA ligase
VLAAICVPKFPDVALSWMQELRAKYDPKYFRLVAPHVTLVFPNSALPESSFVEHVASCVRGVEAATVEFPSAEEHRDEGTGLHFVWLAAGAGSDLLVRLHEKLYTGPLAVEARRGIAFVPHVTLGRFDTSAEAAAVAARINSEQRTTAGRIDSVDVVAVSESLVRKVHRETFAVG